MPIWISYDLSVQLSAKSNKNVAQQKGQCITYILTRPCLIFLRLSLAEFAFLHECIQIEIYSI